MFVDLLQKGVRTAYRALGAREVSFRHNGASVGGFEFEQEGGRPFVLLHGLGDACTTWFRMVQSLWREGSVLAVDLPPFGLSRLDDAPFVRPRDHAALVADVLRERGEGPAVVIGQSLGGWVAQWLAYDHPGLVDRLVLIAPAGAPLPGSMEAMSLLQPGSLEATEAYVETLWHKMPPGMGLALVEMRDRLSAPEIQGFLEGLRPEDALLPKALARIDVPALVVWGREDRLLDARTPAYLAKHWGGPISRDYLARAAHMVHQERPRQVARRILDHA